MRACERQKESVRAETSDCVHAVVPTVVCHLNCVPLSFFREGKMFTYSAKAGTLNTFPFCAGEVDIVVILTS